MTTPDARFSRAFLAVSYVLGEGVVSIGPRGGDDDTQRLRQVLADGARADRARALAREVHRVVWALEQGTLR